MGFQFVKAQKVEAKARIALVGMSGSGKTRSSLRLAFGLCDNARVGVIDTESGSASKYANLFDFDTVQLDSYHPQQFIDAIRAGEEAGFDVLIIDSLSHAWFGKDGELELVDRKAAQSKSNNTYFAWRDVTPLHNQLIHAILHSKCHVIATMRTKTEYVIEDNDRNKKTPKKVGTAPIMRDGMDYEFDVVFDLNEQHQGIVTKTRCDALDNAVLPLITEETGRIIAIWLRGKPIDVSQVKKSAALQQTSPEPQIDPALEAADAIAKKANGSFKKAYEADREVWEVMSVEKWTEYLTAVNQERMCLKDMCALGEELFKDKPQELESFQAITKAVKNAFLSGVCEDGERMTLAVLRQENNQLAFGLAAQKNGLKREELVKLLMDSTQDPALLEEITKHAEDAGWLYGCAMAQGITTGLL